MHLSKNMPAMTGALTWAKMLRERIQIPWNNLQFVLELYVFSYSFEILIFFFNDSNESKLIIYITEV